MWRGGLSLRNGDNGTIRINRMIVAFRRPPVEKHLRRLRAVRNTDRLPVLHSQYGEIDY
jgi:hypothetical protein